MGLQGMSKDCRGTLFLRGRIRAQLFGVTYLGATELVLVKWYMVAAYGQIRALVVGIFLIAMVRGASLCILARARPWQLGRLV